jgi:molybdate transport system permease protein
MWLSPEEAQALWLSAKVALFATLVCLPPAIALAWWLERRRFPGRGHVDGVGPLPLVFPPGGAG